MKALSLLLLFTFAYRIYADCPNGTFPNASGGKCYFIPNDSENFILAEMNCQEQNGDLASISNAFDNNALRGKNYGWITFTFITGCCAQNAPSACNNAQCG